MNPIPRTIAAGTIARTVSRLAVAPAAVLSLALLATAAGCGDTRIDVQPVDGNVLAAHVVVRLPNVARARVVYAAPSASGDGAQGATPDFAAVSGVVDVPVLGLLPATSYELQVVAVTTDGGEAWPAPVTFQTGALPPEVPTFVVAPGSTPPDGFTMIAPVTPPSSSGHVAPSKAPPLIVDGTGRVVWYHAMPAALTNTLDWQRQPDGTFTVGVAGTPDSPIGGYWQLDLLGNVLHQWVPAAGLDSDEHDFRLLPDGTALLFAFETRPIDMTSVGGVAGEPVTGDVLQRLDGAGKLLFSWNAFDTEVIDELDPSVPVDKPPVDWIHGNAIDVTADGNYLVSLRDVSTVIKIDANTGKPLWRFGGKRSDFTFPDDPLGGPSMQHGVRELPNGHLILFDNGNEHSPPQSRVAEYSLDVANHVAHLVWSFGDGSVFSAFMGFADRLPNGNTLIAWGAVPRVQEVTQYGTVVWDLRPVEKFLPYRAFRIPSLY